MIVIVTITTSKLAKSMVHMKITEVVQGVVQPSPKGLAHTAGRKIRMAVGLGVAVIMTIVVVCLTDSTLAVTMVASIAVQDITIFSIASGLVHTCPVVVYSAVVTSIHAIALTVGNWIRTAAKHVVITERSTHVLMNS